MRKADLPVGTRVSWTRGAQTGTGTVRALSIGNGQLNDDTLTSVTVESDTVVSTRPATSRFPNGQQITQLLFRDTEIDQFLSAL